MNPDCRDGKHSSCSGTGFNEDTDQVEECICPCHDPNHDHVHQAPSSQDLEWGETADNTGKIAEREDVLEGRVVAEGELVRPPRCDRCTMANCKLCTGIRWDFIALQTAACECECRSPKFVFYNPPVTEEAMVRLSLELRLRSRLR